MKTCPDCGIKFYYDDQTYPTCSVCTVKRAQKAESCQNCGNESEALFDGLCPECITTPGVRSGIEEERENRREFLRRDRKILWPLTHKIDIRTGLLFKL